jgi:hypothetical protein
MSLSDFHFDQNDGTYDLLSFNEMRELFKLTDSTDESELSVNKHDHLLTAKFILKSEDVSIIIAGDHDLRLEMIDLQS